MKTPRNYLTFNMLNIYGQTLVNSLKLMITIVLALSLLTSCSDDDSPRPLVEPILEIKEGADNDGKTFVPSSNIEFLLAATKGSEDLSNIRVLERSGIFDSNSPVNPSRIVFGSSNVDNNPFSISDSKGGFEKEFLLAANENSGNYTVLIIIEDVNGNADSVTFTYRSLPPNLTFLTGELFNKDTEDPFASGGINLESGDGLFYNDPSAHIMDLGEEESLWIQGIAPIPENNIGLVQLFDAPPIDEITWYSEITSLYDGGTSVPSSGTSQKVEVGDVFIARRDMRFYYFVITEIHISPTDNSHRYVMDIKKGGPI